MTIKAEVIDSADLSLLAAIHNRCFEKPWDRAAMDSMLAIAGTVAVLAQDRGFGILRHLGEDAEILTLAVLPEHRRSGIGDAIVRAMLSHAARKGAKAVFLEVSEHNKAACRLYEKNGFESVSRRREYYLRPDGTREHALILRRLLPAKDI